MDKQTAPAEDDSGSAFLPETQELTFNGAPITIAPLGVLKVIRITQVLKRVLPALDSVNTLLEKGEDLGIDDAGLIVSLLADYGEPLLEAVAIATDVPLQDVQTSTDAAGLVRVIAAIIRVNYDFFAQQAAPYLAGLRSGAAESGDGKTPSTGSSTPGIH